MNKTCRRTLSRSIDSPSFVPRYARTSSARSSSTTTIPRATTLSNTSSSSRWAKTLKRPVLVKPPVGGRPRRSATWPQTTWTTTRALAPAPPVATCCTKYSTRYSSRSAASRSISLLNRWITCSRPRLK